MPVCNDCGVFDWGIEWCPRRGYVCDDCCRKCNEEVPCSLAEGYFDDC